MSTCSRPSVVVIPVLGLPLFKAGDDLATLIHTAMEASGEQLLDGDVLVIAQKAISKAEGRTMRLNAVSASREAQELAGVSGKPTEMAELILREASEVMRAVPGIVITRHRTGHVLANAGIDQSNVEQGARGDVALLWPVDPDASARELRHALQTRTGARIAVVISDSLGRAWRLGTTGHAIGVAGMKPLRDRRGETDLFGRQLQATIIAVADEIAAAASLVMGEAAEGIPAAIVRGATYEPDEEETGVSALLRPVEQDLFR